MTESPLHPPESRRMDRRRVAVPVSTVWTDPAAVRPVDAPAVAASPDLEAWTAAMGEEERLDLHGRVVTQALLGQEAVVEEERAGWARVVLPGQPSSLHDGGYPGWVPAAHLMAWAPAPPGPKVVVAVRATAPVVGGTGLSFGTLLCRARDDGGLRAVTGRAVSLDAADVRLPSGGGDAVAAAAEAFLGLPYLWGGVSGWGVDCSGLAWLCHRRCGRRIPRDAHDQAASGVAVERAELRPGDLVFFARPGQPVHHVGVALGPDEMIHAPGTGAPVERSGIDAPGRGAVVAARRFA